MKFDNAPVTFTESNGYYVSNKMSLITTGLSGQGSVSLVNAPTGSTLINNKIDKNGNGTFQIQIPKSSIEAGKTVSFSIKASGNYSVKKMYDYYLNPYNGITYQQVIYGKVYTNLVPMNASKSMSLTRGINKLNITKVDEKGNALANAGLTLYKGNCVNATCTDMYATWTSTTSAKEFTNIPVGTYTLVETKTPAGYRTASKMLITIDSDNKTYTYKMVDVKNLSVRISKTDLTGQKEIPGATLVLKNASGSVVETWVSTNAPHYSVLAPGEYFLTETVAPNGYVLSTDTINFKIDTNALSKEIDTIKKNLKNICNSFKKEN